jgi:tRNA threonylcarbamoyl adenosine modification protein YjeE
LRFSLTHLSRSARETFEIGRALGALLAPDRPAAPAPSTGGEPAGRVLALLGELGSGKTTFTKGLASGAGVREPDRVTSPTFVLRQDYLGRRPIHHYDLYRLSRPEELPALGFEEDLGGGGLVVVEWAERAGPALPPEALTIEFRHQAGPPSVPGTSPEDQGRREITFLGEPALWELPVTRALAVAESR